MPQFRDITSCRPAKYIRQGRRHGGARGASAPAKIIASDILPLQIEVARKKDKEVGIPDGFVEY